MDPGPSGFTPPEAMHAKFVSPRRPGRITPSPVTGFLQQGYYVPEDLATPRRLPPLHPEASVDLETSLRRSRGSICEVGRCGESWEKRSRSARLKPLNALEMSGGKRAR
jgi:hypothetical protein